MLVQCLQLWNLDHLTTIVALDAFALQHPLCPYDEITPVHSDSGICPLALLIFVLIILEFVVTVLLVKMMVPLRLAIKLHIAHRRARLHFEGAQRLLALPVVVDEGIPRGTHHIVLQYPDPR